MFQQIYCLRLALQPCWHKAFVILSLSELILHFRCMEYIIVEPRYEKHIALIRLNRPKELNALHLELMAELRDALKMLDADEEVRVIVLTGNERAFAAGADIKQMAGKNAIDMLKIDQFSTWDQIKKTKKPIIAAVSGFALGGGNELVMHCDMVIALKQLCLVNPKIKWCNARCWRHTTLAACRWQRTPWKWYLPADLSRHKGPMNWFGEQGSARGAVPRRSREAA